MSDASPPWQAPEMAHVPSGQFLMGSAMPDRFANSTERPPHLVTLAAFALAIHPVTVAQYQCCKPAHAPDEPADWPVANVSWQEAQDYCAWLSQATSCPYRLPSEAEWEYACRAGTSTMFFFGDALTTPQANFLFDENGQRLGPGARTATGAHPANAFGLSDMHGNVCEWVQDAWHADYAGAPTDGSAWISGDASSRVIRGGAWDYLPRLLRSAWRDRLPVLSRRDNVGFRVASNDTSTSNTHP